ncbi:MAG: LamG domain-containing protein [Candidatus Brocadiaceae bacterium]|nr:LamG domain-containing protein [Candidatus Brocadiaceae bacterium]
MELHGPPVRMALVLIGDGIDDSVDFTTNLGISGELTVSAWVYPAAGLMARTSLPRPIFGTVMQRSYGGWTLGLNDDSIDQHIFRIMIVQGMARVRTRQFLLQITSTNGRMWVFRPSQHGGSMQTGDGRRGCNECSCGNCVLVGRHKPCALVQGQIPMRAVAGGIDEVRIYSQALSDQEILDLYSNDVTPTPTPTVTPTPTAAPSPTPTLTPTNGYAD